MKQTMLDQVRAARRVNVPIISIATPDQTATIRAISAFYATTTGEQAVTLLQWDCIRGAVALNDKGKPAITALRTSEGSKDLDDAAMLCQLTDMLHRCSRVGLTPTGTGMKSASGEYEMTTGRLPARSIVFIMNAHRHVVVENPPAIQAIANCREPFKISFRTIILLAPDFTPPVELADDIMPIEEALPSPDELSSIVKKNYDNAKRKEKKLPALTDSDLDKSVDAIRGLSAFVSEQVVSLALTIDGINLDTLWERKRKMVESTPGLSVWRGGERFADIGGLSNLKQFLSSVLKGNGAPRCIVFIDEIEKSLAGSSGPVGDSTGVSQAMLGTMLSYMQDKDAAGTILIGPAGTGKSMIAKAAGNEVGIPTVYFDLAGMKNALVGESEANLRRALRVVSAISNDAALFIATSNSIASLPPELRRRYQLGTIFVDLLSKDERAAVWKMYTAKYNLDPAQALPHDEGWSGAEIKACCEIAWRLTVSIAEAGKYIVPVAISAKELIQGLRKTASNRFISASYPGLYKYTELKSIDEIETVPFEPGGKREYDLN